MSTVVDDLKAQADKAVAAAASALEAQAAAQAQATSSKLQAAALALKSDADQQLITVKGKLNAELAKKPKTVLVIALIAGVVLGLLLSSFVAKAAGAAKGATAPHAAYAKPERPTAWREFVPFDDGGAAGHG